MFMNQGILAAQKNIRQSAMATPSSIMSCRSKANANALNRDPRIERAAQRPNWAGEGTGATSTWIDGGKRLSMRSSGSVANAMFFCVGDGSGGVGGSVRWILFL